MRINDFDSAVFYQSADKECFAKASLRPDLGLSKDTIIYYPLGFIINLSEKIDHFEELQEGKYLMGSGPSFVASQLDTSGAKFIVRASVPSRDTSRSLTSIRYREDQELPFAADAEKYFFDDFPDWGFGFGYSAYFADLSGLTSALTKVENRFRSLGYDIESNTLDTHVSPLRLLDLKVRFSSSFGAICEAGKAIGSDNVLLEWFSASLLYRFQIIKETRIFPFVGAGVTVIYLSGDQTYNNRISPIDTLFPGLDDYEYTQLQSVSVTASETGMSITVGADLDYFNVFSVTPYVMVSAFPTIKTQLSDGTPVSLHPSCVVVGIRATVYF